MSVPIMGIARGIPEFATAKNPQNLMGSIECDKESFILYLEDACAQHDKSKAIFIFMACEDFESACEDLFWGKIACRMETMHYLAAIHALQTESLDPSFIAGLYFIPVTKAMATQNDFLKNIALVWIERKS